MKNYYEVLGVSQDASNDEIKRAYHKIVRETHPDMNNGSRHREEEFVMATEAYTVLSNPKTRMEYDNGRVEEASEQEFNNAFNEINYSVRIFLHKLSEYQDAARFALLKGIFWFVLGLGTTLYSYHEASMGYNGGMYRIFWGAMLVGIVLSGRAIMAYVKINNAIKQIKKDYDFF